MPHDFSSYLPIPKNVTVNPSNFAISYVLPKVTEDAPFTIESVPQEGCKDCTKSQTPFHYDQSGGYVLMKSDPSSRFDYWYPSLSELETIPSWTSEGILDGSVTLKEWFLRAQSIVTLLHESVHGLVAANLWTGSYHDANFVRYWEFRVTSVSGNQMTISNDSEGHNFQTMDIVSGYTSIQVGDQVRFLNRSIYSARDQSFRITSVDYGNGIPDSYRSSITVTLDKDCSNAFLDQTDGSTIGYLVVSIGREQYAPMPWEEFHPDDLHKGFKVSYKFNPNVVQNFIGGWGDPADGSPTDLPLVRPKVVDGAVTLSGSFSSVVTRNPTFVMTPLPLGKCELSPSRSGLSDPPNSNEASAYLAPGLIKVNKMKSVFVHVVVNTGNNALEEGDSWSVSGTLPTGVDIETISAPGGIVQGGGGSTSATGQAFSTSGTIGETEGSVDGSFIAAVLELKMNPSAVYEDTIAALPENPNSYPANDVPDCRTFTAFKRKVSGGVLISQDITYTNGWIDTNYLQDDTIVANEGGFRIAHPSGDNPKSYIRGGCIGAIFDKGEFDGWDELEITYFYQAIDDDERKFHVTVPMRCKNSVQLYNGEVGVTRNDGAKPNPGKWVCTLWKYKKLVGFTGGFVQTPIYEDAYATGYDDYRPVCAQAGNCDKFKRMGSGDINSPGKIKSAFEQFWGQGSTILYQINVGNANFNSFIVRRVGCPSIQYMTTTEYMRMPVSYTNFAEPLDNGGYYDFDSVPFRELADDDGDETFTWHYRTGSRLYDGFAIADESNVDFGSGEEAFDGIMPRRLAPTWKKVLRKDEITDLNGNDDAHEEMRRHENKWGTSYMRESFSILNNGLANLNRVVSSIDNRILFPAIWSYMGEEFPTENGRSKFSWKFYDANFAELSPVTAFDGSNFDDTVPEDAVYFGKMEIGPPGPDNHRKSFLTSDTRESEQPFNSANVASASVDGSLIKLELANKNVSAGHIVVSLEGSYDRVVAVAAGGQTVNLPTYARINNRYAGSAFLSNGPNPTGVCAGDVCRITLNGVERGFYVEKGLPCEGTKESWLPKQNAGRVTARGINYIQGNSGFRNTLFRRKVNNVDFANLTVTSGATTLSPHPNSKLPHALVSPPSLSVDEYFWRVVSLPDEAGTGVTENWLEVWFSDKRLPDPDDVDNGSQESNSFNITANLYGGGTEFSSAFTLLRGNLIFPLGREPYNNEIHSITWFYGLTVFEVLQDSSVGEAIFDNWPFKISMSPYNDLDGSENPIPGNPSDGSWPGNWGGFDKYFLNSFTIDGNLRKGFLVPAFSAHQVFEVVYTDSSIATQPSESYYDNTFGLVPGLPREFKEWGNKRDVVWIRDHANVLSDAIGDLSGVSVDFTRGGKLSADGITSIKVDSPAGGTPGTGIETETFTEVSASGWNLKSPADGEAFFLLAQGKSLFTGNKSNCFAVDAKRVRVDNAITPRDYEITRDAMQELDTAKNSLVATTLKAAVRGRVYYDPCSCLGVGENLEFSSKIDYNPGCSGIPCLEPKYGAPYDCPANPFTTIFIGLNVPEDFYVTSGVGWSNDAQSIVGGTAGKIPFLEIKGGVFWDIPDGAEIISSGVVISTSDARVINREYVRYYHQGTGNDPPQPQYPCGVGFSYGQSSSFEDTDEEMDIEMTPVHIIRDPEDRLYNNGEEDPSTGDGYFRRDDMIKIVGNSSFMSNFPLNDEAHVDVTDAVKALFQNRSEPSRAAGLLLIPTNTEYVSVNTSGLSFVFPPWEPKDICVDTVEDLSLPPCNERTVDVSERFKGYSSDFFANLIGPKDFYIKFKIDGNVVTRYPTFRNMPSVID